MEFYCMVKEWLEEFYPPEVNERAFPIINELEELQKTKKKKSKVDEKILGPIVKAEKELWKIIEDYQESFASNLSFDEVLFSEDKFDGFASPWQYIGIEKKLLNYVRNNAELFEKKERKFPCDKCWDSPDDVTTYFLSVYDENLNNANMTWFRGVAKKRKYFKKGIYVYGCKRCKKWKVSSTIYNPHG